MFESEDELFEALKKALKRARKKHPLYAIGEAQALGVIAQEFGELSIELTKGKWDGTQWHLKDGWEERAFNEALDLLTVTARFLLGEHEVQDG